MGSGGGLSICLEGTGCPQCQEAILGALGSHGQHLTLSPAPSAVQELYPCRGLQAPQRPGELGIHVSALRGEVSSRKVRKSAKSPAWKVPEVGSGWPQQVVRW